jgi:hypothetical protein
MDVVSTTLIPFRLNHLIQSLSEVCIHLCVTRSQGWVPLNDALGKALQSFESLNQILPFVPIFGP